MATPLTQAIMLLMAFTMLPAPTGPTWKMLGPIARRTGLARSIGLGLRSKTVIGNDCFKMLPAMGLPMFPTPMNPTLTAMRSLLARFPASYARSSRRDFAGVDFDGRSASYG